MKSSWGNIRAKVTAWTGHWDPGATVYKYGVYKYGGHDHFVMESEAVS